MTLKFCVFHFSAVFFARIFSFCPWNRQLQQQQQQWKLVRSPRFDKQHSHSLLFNETISLESTFRSLEINKHTHYALCAYIFEWLTLVLRPKYEYIHVRWFGTILARYPFIHPSIEPSSHAESTNVRNVKLKGNTFYQSKKSERKTLHWFFERNSQPHIVNCELGKLAAFDISMYAARRRLFVNQFVFVSFYFFARRQCTHTSMEYKL